MGKDAVDPADPVALAERVARLEAELDELRTSRASFQALVESVPDFVVRVGPTGVFEYVNRVAPGLTREQVVGHTIFEFTDLAYHTEIRASIERVLATGEPGAYETTGAGADGATVPYFSRIGPIVEHGKVVALTVVATDVSYVKQTARQLAEHQDRVDLAASAASPR